MRLFRDTSFFHCLPYHPLRVVILCLVEMESLWILGEKGNSVIEAYSWSEDLDPLEARVTFYSMEKNSHKSLGIFV